jgi:hypothetical protein
MALFDTLRIAVNRLAPRGWKSMMDAHGLHLDAPNLSAELRRPLVDANGKSTIDRTIPGFEDFSPDGTAAIEPGDPARGLLYHALASPNVYPRPAGLRTDDDFPTILELDVIENYIYAVANRRLVDLGDVVVAVFAFQYRPGSTSVHGKHADMAFSRTGIARVGTAAAHYDPIRRSFWAAPAGGASGIAVMPAKYGVFLAQRRKLTSADAVMHPLNATLPGDDDNVFLLPVHKLFSGTECLVGEIVKLSFQEFHRSEKLRRIHLLPPVRGGVAPIPGFNINQFPFVRDSRDLVTLQPAGASALLASNPSNQLVELATQMNTVTGKRETVRFRVPAETANNRFAASSLDIPATNAGRAAPEYAHVRFHVRPNGQLFDVNSLESSNYFQVIKHAQFNGVPGVDDGPLEAAHLLDNTCDGAISAQATLSKPLKNYAGLSFVAAPDFLPLVGQIDVQFWAERNGLTGSTFFTQGGPEPLCYGRDVMPNPTVPNPSNHAGPAFDRTDQANATITALIGSAPRGHAALPRGKASVASTWLADGAANVFAPGWDTSTFSDSQGAFYANYGLGSPFPEDAKLCAALNSFWPAAAPDTGRTFGGLTALPLLDRELGFHPNHPAVLAGNASSSPGWDGEYGPFLTSNGTKVSFASLERSDYTSAAFAGKVSLGLLGQIEADEQLARMDAFRECADRIRSAATPMARFRSLLVTAEGIPDWSSRADRFDSTLIGLGYHYVFADVQDPEEDPADKRRLLADVRNIFICQISGQKVGIRKNNSPPTVTARLYS